MEKMLLAQVQEAGIAFNGIDLYDSDYDEDPAAQASFIANLSSYSSNYFEQTPIDSYPDNEITSDSNIIPYSQYLLETQQEVVQDTNSSTQQDLMRIKPTLYDGSVISRQHEVIHVTDEEETLIVEELNKLSEDFRKCFVPQMKLSAEQAFWLTLSNPNSEQPNVTQTRVRVECSIDKKLFEIEKKELKLENERLLEHIICQDVVNIVMYADVKSVNVLPMQNTFLDDNIALDVMKMENDRLMELLVSQDLVHTIVNSLAAINDYKSMEKSYVQAYNQCLKLETELSKRNNMIEQDVFIELSQPYSQLEQHCISFEIPMQQKKKVFKMPNHAEIRMLLNFVNSS
ncbi:hypothetical protein Tco_1050602 [Tanacetum coccineum]